MTNDTPWPLGPTAAWTRLLLLLLEGWRLHGTVAYPFSFEKDDEGHQWVKFKHSKLGVDGHVSLC